jgi:hypothetical protein
MTLPLFADRKPSAVFDGPYRYILRWPTGIDNDRILAVIGANPSKAGQLVNGVMRSDPTVSRMRSLAAELDFGWLWMLNVRAYVATDPKDVPEDPVAWGPQNSDWIAKSCAKADMVLCAWGNLAGDSLERIMLQMIRGYGKVPHALALTKDGHPHHPRGVPKSARPFPMVTR